MEAPPAPAVPAAAEESDALPAGDAADAGSVWGPSGADEQALREAAEALVLQACRRGGAAALCTSGAIEWMDAPRSVLPLGLFNTA